MPPFITLWSAALQAILDTAEDVGPPDGFTEMIGQLLAAIGVLMGGDRVSLIRSGRPTATPIVVGNKPLKAVPPDNTSIDQLRLDLSYRCGNEVLIVVERWTAPTFNEADRLTLRLLRPHVELAFRKVALPAPPLTARETEVLLQVRNGLGNAEIAKQLGVAEATVVKHLEHVFRRSGAHSRTEAVRIYESALS